MIKKTPFVLRLSKHENHFFSSLLEHSTTVIEIERNLDHDSTDPSS
jgi:hypothetical protein